MKFRCFVCDNKNPCNLVTKYIGDVPPTLCPFKTEKMAIANWKKQTNQNDTTQILLIGGDDNLVI